MNHPKHYFRCKYLGWHRPAFIEYQDAMITESKYKYCGRSIMTKKNMLDGYTQSVQELVKISISEVII